MRQVIAKQPDVMIIVDADVCSGCLACELACSLAHDGVLDQLHSRIRILCWDEVAAYIPVLCQSCVIPACQNACPTGARRRDEGTGVMVSDKRYCAGCRSCLYACPYGAPVLHPSRGQAISCDLCQGDPACVKVCHTGALLLKPTSEAGESRRLRTAIRLGRRSHTKER